MFEPYEIEKLQEGVTHIDIPLLRKPQQALDEKSSEDDIGKSQV